jgi:glycosyltransferase involved in cell wall biosynthesis
MARRRLLSIAHSYVVALNRRLAHELTRAGSHEWEVTAVAPLFFRGERDLRPVTLERLAEEPCSLIGVPARLTGRIHLFYYGRELRRILRDRWDLIHCWEEPYIHAGGQVAWWTPKKTPLVYWTAQNLSKRYLPPFNLIERLCLRRASGWMACGQSTLDTMVARGYGHLPHQVMPLGVDLQAFRCDAAAGLAVRHSLDWTTGPPVVGYLGRFVPEKGIDLLVRVLDGLKPAWRALFVGGGPLERELRVWASRYPDRARICTGVMHAEVPRYLNAMDCLCAPSQTTQRWREQFGRMLVEAFACGVPVIGSDSGEIPYVIGDAGLVVGERDETGWREALAHLIENPHQRRELSVRGLERANSRYAWPVLARQHLSFFDQLLDKSIG